MSQFHVNVLTNELFRPALVSYSQLISVNDALNRRRFDLTPGGLMSVVRGFARCKEDTDESVIGDADMYFYLIINRQVCDGEIQTAFKTG